ncbi:DNA-processing protein DprA [Leifsonia sp. 22587]|uniref:DNA-processing protein DprA n=1 Tax=Leifsonia sp. 22587 TaxID=3453946 RepID=UPI003F824F3B
MAEHVRELAVEKPVTPPETDAPAGADASTREVRRSPRSGIPGIGTSELARLMGSVRGGPDHEDEALGSDALVERFARAALSTAIEPGDLDAGRAIDAVGALGLLRAIVDGEGARTLLDRMHGSGASVGPRGEQLRVVPFTDIDRRLQDRSHATGASGLEARGERRMAESLERWRPRLSLDEARRALERAQKIGARLVTPDSPLWPDGFDALDDGPPVAVWVRGDPWRLRTLDRSIALVGARASTQYGEHVAMESAAGLVDRGFAVVSGGAYGIDAAAHRAALLSGGVTVAFLAGGADRLYPAGNSELLRRIAADGLLIAELPPGSAPTRWRFLMRNRLIAAAAGATVVVEAGHRSGSLNTAGHAAQMGRPLGAVPGSILSPASAGCHRLIREYAATCVTTVEEMAELADPLGTGPRDDPEGGAPAGEGAAEGPEGAIVAHLSRTRRASADEIAARAALPFTTVAAVLGRLDLAGRARESGGGWVLVGERSG